MYDFEFIAKSPLCVHETNPACSTENKESFTIWAHLSLETLSQIKAEDLSWDPIKLPHKATGDRQGLCYECLFVTKLREI